MELKRATYPETGYLAQAGRMHRREGLEGDDWTERVLVAYANYDDRQAGSIAEALSEHLKRDGFIVELADASKAPPPEDYDAIVIGSAVRFGRYARPAIRYIEEHREALTAMPAFWFSVDAEAASPGSSDPDAHVRQLIRKTSWRPTDSAVFAPWERARSPLQRLLGSVTGHRASEPPWAAVRELASRIGHQVPSVRLQTRAV